MTAKEYLSRYRHLNDDINAKSDGATYKMSITVSMTVGNQKFVERFPELKV